MSAINYYRKEVSNMKYQEEGGEGGDTGEGGAAPEGGDAPE